MLCKRLLQLSSTTSPLIEYGLYSQRLLMQQVCNVARLLLTLPATNATSERTFSTMRRLKTYLRSTMSQMRLNHVMILSIHKELVSELDLHDIANQFVSGSHF